jgi:hypothetical protein
MIKVQIPALRPLQPPIQWVLGALPGGVMKLGHEDYHCSPSSAEVKRKWSHTFTPTVCTCTWTTLYLLPQELTLHTSQHKLLKVISAIHSESRGNMLHDYELN